jgi:CRP-like cAMP-binding protein
MTGMATTSQLAAIPLFESSSSSDLDELAPWFDVQITGEDVRLIGEGSSGYSFFILTQGSAAVTTSDGAHADLGPGDFFGEIAILGDGRRTATVTTTSPSQLLVMFGTEFRRLQQAHPDIAGRIEEAMRQRVSVRA